MGQCRTDLERHRAANGDGTVTLQEGSTDIGGTRTSIAMQLAEVLGIPVEDVVPSVVDTDSVGYTEVTGGSRVTFATGWAAYNAGQAIKSQLIEQAAEVWKVDKDQVTLADGVIATTNGDSRSMTIKELAADLSQKGIDVGSRETVTPQNHGGAYATHVVDVEVDPDTGKVTILRYTAVQDAGRAIHPSYVEGQMQGGVVQGIAGPSTRSISTTRKGT